MTRWAFSSVLTLILAIAVLAVFAPRAEAAIFVRIDGIDGDATHDEHVNWIDAISAGESISRAITLRGDGSGRDVPEPIFGDFQIVKRFDSSSPFLRQLAAGQTTGREVIIHFVTTGSPGATFFEIILTDALVSSVSMAFDLSSGQSVPVEVITISFTSIQWKFIPVTGQAGSPITKGYDLLGMRPL